jgi:hypothetical protein
MGDAESAAALGPSTWAGPASYHLEQFGIRTLGQREQCRSQAEQHGGACDRLPNNALQPIVGAVAVVANCATAALAPPSAERER